MLRGWSFVVGERAMMLSLSPRMSSGIQQRMTMLPSAVADFRFNPAGCCTIRQNRKPITQMFMDVLSDESIHLMTA
jgi:hypothetical protein